MTIIRIAGVKRYKSNGRWYLYHRATGKRIESAPGTPEFFAEVDRLNGKLEMLAPKAGTVGALITAYRASPEFQRLAAATRSDYQDVFDWLKSIEGVEVGKINGAVVIGLRDKAYARRKRRFANYVVQVLRLLFSWGMPRDWVKTNPAAGIPLIRRPKGAAPANRPWTDRELAVVLEDFRKAPSLLPGLALGVYAAVTEADVVRLPWSAYDGARLRFQRGKTGSRSTSPPTAT